MSVFYLCMPFYVSILHVPLILGTLVYSSNQADVTDLF